MRGAHHGALEPEFAGGLGDEAPGGGRRDHDQDGVRVRRQQACHRGNIVRGVRRHLLQLAHALETPSGERRLEPIVQTHRALFGDSANGYLLRFRVGLLKVVEEIGHQLIVRPVEPGMEGPVRRDIGVALIVYCLRGILGVDICQHDSRFSTHRVDHVLEGIDQRAHDERGPILLDHLLSCGGCLVDTHGVIFHHELDHVRVVADLQATGVIDLGGSELPTGLAGHSTCSGGAGKEGDAPDDEFFHLSSSRCLGRRSRRVSRRSRCRRTGGRGRPSGGCRLFVFAACRHQRYETQDQYQNDQRRNPLCFLHFAPPLPLLSVTLV